MSRLLQRVKDCLLLVLLYILLVLVAFPLVIIIFLPTLGIRVAVAWIAKRFKKQTLGKMLNATGTQFANMPLNQGTILVQPVFQGVPCKQNVKEHWEQKVLNAKHPVKRELHLYPELKQTVVTWMGFRFWKDIQNFDLDKYITVLEGQGFVLGSPAWTEFLKSLWKKEWNFGRDPLWELILVPVTKMNENENEPLFAVILRIHHAMCDGYSIVQLLDKVAEPMLFPSIADQSPRRSASVLQKVLFPFRIPYDLARSMIDEWRSIDVFQSSEKDLSGKPTLATGSEPVSLIDMKNVAKSIGSSFTVVYLAMLAGSFRREVLKRWGTLSGDVVIQVPVPLATHPPTLRNYTAMSYITLPITEPDPIKRLIIIRKHLNAARISTYVGVNHAIYKLVACQFPFVFKRIYNAKKKSPAIISSSLPSTPYACSWMGYPMIESQEVVVGYPGTRTILIFFLTMMSNARGRFSMFADDAILSDAEAQDFLKGCRDELNEFKELVSISEKEGFNIEREKNVLDVCEPLVFGQEDEMV